MLLSTGTPAAKRTDEEPPRSPAHHRVVIVGGGFGGLEAAKELAGAPVDITLIDQHLFQPLLYQVATASLATSEIAWPIRALFRGRSEVRTSLATLVGVDTGARRAQLDGGDAVPYDTLILATGARHAYFGHSEWEPFASGLKTIENATTIRRRLLTAFERAEQETDSQLQTALLTFAIVGAGPTERRAPGRPPSCTRMAACPARRGDSRNIRCKR
jgi:NADH dehydrogenase